MKNIKKLFSIVMVLAMVLALGVNAFAATITINEKNAKEGEHGTYKAYQLFTLTTTEEALPDGKGYSYTVNPDYAAYLYTAAGLKDENATNAELVKYLESIKSDAAKVRTFADAVYEAIKALEADYTSADGKFTDVPQGYYLIVEEGATGGAVSQVMLDTAGRENVEITAKEDVPSSQKKVKEHNDTTGLDSANWQDAADYDIGDQVPFQLKATIPAGTTTPYDPYKLVFHDKESEGLTFNSESVKVYLNTVLIESGYDVKTPGEDGCSFDVIFADITALEGFDDTVANVITVEYTSELNSNAKIGSAGNPNTMFLEYSNNPYNETTGKTPDNKVTVFTFELDVNKVDPKGDALKGAAFSLLKEVPADTAIPEGKEVKELSNKEDSNLAEGSYYKIGDKVYEVVKVITAGDTTQFVFNGLDSGNYLLAETTVPNGYNAIDPIEITVTATYETESVDPKLTGLTVTPDTFKPEQDEDNKFTGKIAGDVVNKTGVELPETGGIGTTIFYVVGAILVVGAVILLVTKRRMTGAEK